MPREACEVRRAALADGFKKLKAAGFRPDYLECADPSTLAPVREAGKPARLLAAARLGKTRLIDNIPVDLKRELK